MSMKITRQAFLPISRRESLRIATHALANDARDIRLICHATMPSTCNIYSRHFEPCWYIYTPWNDGKDGMMIRSSRVILVGKLTGIIQFDGSAGDEG